MGLGSGEGCAGGWSFTQALWKWGALCKICPCICGVKKVEGKVA